MNGTYQVFAGRSNPDLATAIAKGLGISLSKATFENFSDGETRVEIEESVRGNDVYVVQSTCAPANDNLMELLASLDALKRASAGSITAVLPYYGYARQDRKVKARTPITAKLVADLLTTAGAQRVVTVDVHAGQIQGFFDCPFDNLFAQGVFLDDIKSRFHGRPPMFVSPDAGGVERTRSYAKKLDTDMAIVDKRRPKPNQSEVMHVIGDVEGRDCILVDDIVDTAGTITAGASALMQKGARSVRAAISHAVLSGPAIERIQASPLTEVVVTDTIPLKSAARDSGKFRVLSVSDLLARGITCIHTGDSISALFV